MSRVKVQVPHSAGADRQSDGKQVVYLYGKCYAELLLLKRICDMDVEFMHNKVAIIFAFSNKNL